MNFQLEGDARDVQEMVREFARRALREGAVERDEQGALDVPKVAALVELGLSGIVIPEARGGLGLGATSYVAAVEELAREDGSLALVIAMMAGPAAAALSTDEAAQRALAEGALVSWSADGALAAVATHAAHFVVGDELSASAEVTPVATLSCPAAGRGDVALTGASRLEGATTRARPWADLGLAAFALGRAESAFEAAVAYAKERRQFRRPIADFQAIQWKLADARVGLDAARVATSRAAHELSAVNAATARLLAAEAAQAACDHALQVHGGYGYTLEYPVARALRDLSVARSESARLRSVIAEPLVAL